MTRVVVAAAGEIPPGGRKLVEVAGRSIGVFHVEGEYFALRNRCPHQGGPLCEGKLGSWIEADRPGEYALTRPNEMIRCPWHGWEFDLRTGQSYWDPRRRRVRPYAVHVASGAGLAAGPYVAETYEVQVDQDYLVLEL
jgi:nitrite reductase/ring-hydroxylating ferredoxin subunit